MNEDVEEILQEIFIEVFEWDAWPSNTPVEQSAISDWDSMKQLNLVTAIESEFDVSLSLQQALALTSFAQAKRTLTQLLSE